MAERVAKETIDERVLRLLGLEDEVEISYEEYIRALKEALSTIQLGKGEYSSEEAMLLQDEFKKVKAKKGRFKPKSKKITADNIATTRFLRPSAKPLLAPAKKPITAEGLSGEGIAKDVEDISAKLDELLKELRDGYRLEKEEAEKNRKEREDKKRKDRERSLKRGQIQAIRAAKKFLAPVQSILDQIVNFITYTLLGRAFKMFMDWSSDPKNKGKLESLGRFIKDWWPTLLGLWFFFVNPLGKFIRTIVGTVLRLTFKLAKFAIPRLVAFIAENPADTAAIGATAAIGGTAVLANEITGQRKAAKVETENKAKAQTGKGIGVQGIGGVGDMGPTTPYGLLQGASRGGFLNTFGNTYQGFTSGTDPAVAGNIYQGYTYGLGSGFPGYYTGGTLGWYEGYKRGGVFSGNVDETTGQYVKGAGPDTQFLPMQGGGGVVLQKGESVLQVGARERMMQQTGIDPLAFNIGANANKPRTIGNNIFGRAFGGLLGYAGGGVLGSRNTTPSAFSIPSISNSFENNFSRPSMRNSFDFSLKNMIGPSSNYFPSSFSPKFAFNLPYPNRMNQGNTNVYLNRSYNGSQGMQGLVRENTGMDFSGFGADRQEVFVQPGEYVLPKKVVETLGVNILDKLVANIDNNSTPAKLGRRNLKITMPEPPARRSARGGMMTLPPIKQSAGGSMPGVNQSVGTVVPSFSVVASAAQEIRMQNAERYGIVA